MLGRQLEIATSQSSQTLAAIVAGRIWRSGGQRHHCVGRQTGPGPQYWNADGRNATDVGVYDLAVFRASDQVRARLQKADQDLETRRNGLSYKEQAKLVRI
jgi:hypothetical protein